MSSSNALVTTVTVPTTEVSNKAMEDTLQEIVGFINTARLLEASKMAWDPGVVTTRWMLSKEIASTLMKSFKAHGTTATFIPPFILSAAAEICDAQMGSGNVMKRLPQWSTVRADDPRIQSHPWASKTCSPVPPVVPPPSPPVAGAAVATAPPRSSASKPSVHPQQLEEAKPSSVSERGRRLRQQCAACAGEIIPLARRAKLMSRRPTPPLADQMNPPCAHCQESKVDCISWITRSGKVASTCVQCWRWKMRCFPTQVHASENCASVQPLQEKYKTQAWARTRPPGTSACVAEDKLAPVDLPELQTRMKPFRQTAGRALLADDTPEEPAAKTQMSAKDHQPMAEQALVLPLNLGFMQDDRPLDLGFPQDNEPLDLGFPQDDEPLDLGFMQTDDQDVQAAAALQDPAPLIPERMNGILPEVLSINPTHMQLKQAQQLKKLISTDYDRQRDLIQLKGQISQLMAHQATLMSDVQGALDNFTSMT